MVSRQPGLHGILRDLLIRAKVPRQTQAVLSLAVKADIQNLGLGRRDSGLHPSSVPSHVT